MDKQNFFEQVYEVVRLIPAGRVTSYGAIAAYLDTKNSSRIVGYAMNGCSSVFPPVPAHRVVNHQGKLSGKHYFGSENMMQQLLENEGIVIINDQIRNFKQVFWDPSAELDPEA